MRHGKRTVPALDRADLRNQQADVAAKLRLGDDPILADAQSPRAAME